MNMSALVDDRSWRRRRWASFGAALALIVVLIPVSQARAESLDCMNLRLLGFNSTATTVQMTRDFEAGEVVTVEITNPTSGTTEATLTVDGVPQGSTQSFPASFSYAFPAGGSYELLAAVDGSATFDFSCAEGTGDGGDSDDSSDALPLEGDECESGKAFGKSVSDNAKAGNMKGKEVAKPGDHKGFSSCKDAG